jgi:anti-sigma factor RsiW
MNEIQPHQPGDLACADVVELVTDYVERALPEPERARLEGHLETCPGCTEYIEQMRSLAGGLRGLSAGSIPASMRDELLAALRDLDGGRADP